MYVHILKDDYAPDAGSKIYGVFSTLELAQKAQAYYESDDNEYGCACEPDTLSIRTVKLQEEFE